MNTLDDLKATLASHAEIQDDNLVGRSGAVAHRVRAARRRRAAVASGTAAVVLGGVVAGAVVLGRPDPANDRLLVGAPVPATMTSTGYAYDFVDGVESEDVERGMHTLRITVPEADEPRLVSWATEGDDQQVRVRARWNDDFVSGRPDFTDFVVVPADESGWVEVEADSRVALATYELGSERPAGYTKEGVTFRQQRAGAELVGAVVGDRGATSVSLTVTLPEGRLLVSDVCQASGSDDLGNGPWSLQTVNGDEISGSSCGRVDHGFLDAGSGGWAPLSDGLVTDAGRLGAGDEATLTITLTEDHRSTDPIVDPDALLGIAVYALPDDRVRVAGGWANPLVERDGHTWALAEVSETRVPAEGWSVAVPESEERLLLGVGQRLRSGTVAPTVDGEPWGTTRGRGAGVGIDGTLPADARRVGLDASRNAQGEASLFFYELVE